MFNPYFSGWNKLSHDPDFCKALAEPMMEYLQSSLDDDGLFFHLFMSTFEKVTSVLWRMGLIYGRAKNPENPGLHLGSNDIPYEDRPAQFPPAFRVPIGEEFDRLMFGGVVAPVDTREVLAAYCNLFDGSYETSFDLGFINDDIFVPINHVTAFEHMERLGFARRSPETGAYSWTQMFKALVSESHDY